MKSETFFEEVTEKWGSGCVTAMKSGNSFHIIVPKAIERELGIENRDRVFVKFAKVGDKKGDKDPRYKNYRLANLRAKEKIEDLKPLEKDFVKAYREYGDKVVESAYGTIGKYRTDELIKKFGTKKDVEDTSSKPEGVEENEPEDSVEEIKET